MPSFSSLAPVLFASLLAFISAWIWFSRGQAIAKARDLAEGHTLLLNRVSELEAKQRELNQSVVPINAAMQALLIRELTHFHTPEMDALLVKLGPPNTLSEAEELRLSVMLEERSHDVGIDMSPSERDAAFILPAIIRRAHREASVIETAEALKLQLMQVAAVIGVPVIHSTEK